MTFGLKGYPSLLERWICDWLFFNITFGSLTYMQLFYVKTHVDHHKVLLLANSKVSLIYLFFSLFTPSLTCLVYSQSWWMGHQSVVCFGLQLLLNVWVWGGMERWKRWREQARHKRKMAEMRWWMSMKRIKKRKTWKDCDDRTEAIL